MRAAKRDTDGDTKQQDNFLGPGDASGRASNVAEEGRRHILSYCWLYYF